MCAGYGYGRSSRPLYPFRLYRLPAAVVGDMGMAKGCSAIVDSGTSLLAGPSEIIAEINRQLAHLELLARNATICLANMGSYSLIFWSRSCQNTSVLGLESALWTFMEKGPIYQVCWRRVKKMHKMICCVMHAGKLQLGHKADS